MLIFAIIVSTMITVAIVVFAVQCYSYRKNHAKLGELRTRKESAAGAQEMPIAS